MSYLYQYMSEDNFNVIFCQYAGEGYESSQLVEENMTKQEAIDHIHYLNGGEIDREYTIEVPPIDIEAELKVLKDMPDFRRGYVDSNSLIDQIENILLCNDTPTAIGLMINDAIETYRETEHD